MSPVTRGLRTTACHEEGESQQQESCCAHAALRRLSTGRRRARGAKQRRAVATCWIWGRRQPTLVPKHAASQAGIMSLVRLRRDGRTHCGHVSAGGGCRAHLPKPSGRRPAARAPPGRRPCTPTGLHCSWAWRASGGRCAEGPAGVGHSLAARLLPLANLRLTPVLFVHPRFWLAEQQGADAAQWSRRSSAWHTGVGREGLAAGVLWLLD